MDDSSSTIATIDHDAHQLTRTKPDFKALPPVYVLAAHLSINEQHEAEDALSHGGASLTYEIHEARLVLGNISRPKRAKSELQWKGVRVEDVNDKPSAENPISSLNPEDRGPARKRKRLGDRDDDLSKSNVGVVIDDLSTTDDEQESSDVTSSNTRAAKDTPPSPTLSGSPSDRVMVIKLDWLNDSLSAGRVLPLEPYSIYTGRVVPLEEPATNHPAAMKVNGMKSFTSNKSTDIEETLSRGIMERAKADPKPTVNRYIKRDRIKDAANKDFVGKSFSSSTQAAGQPSSQHITRPTHLLHQTTSEHDEVASSALPPMPDWVRENKIYACERATPLTSPNEAFICQLKKIKLARLLTLDEIGVRAYSSSIASLAAYPYPIQSTREILALPRYVQFGIIPSVGSKLGSVHISGAGQFSTVKSSPNSSNKPRFLSTKPKGAMLTPKLA